MTQKILTVDAPLLDWLYAQPGFHADTSDILRVLKIISAVGHFRERTEAEADSGLRQIIACAVVHKRERLLHIRRAANTGRDSLRLKYTLMFGGHVDAEDEDADSNVRKTLENCLRRELREELGLETGPSPQIIGVVADSRNDVGMRHLGVIFECAITADSVLISPALDNSEFVNRGRKAPHPLCAAAELETKANAGKLDAWSSLFLQSNFAVEHFQRDFHMQAFLPGY